MARARRGRLARTATVLALAGTLAQACTSSSLVADTPISPSEQVLVAESGGVYQDRALAAYVRGVGLGLVEAAGQPRHDWQFLVLDTPDANAFTLPGHRIYVTRGMLALANDEAELAAILAHEIGHAVSGDVGPSVSDGNRRASELRADRLGMSYLVRAGYDARGQADFMATLLDYHRLAIEIAGGNPAHAASGGPDHPALASRLMIARREAARAPAGRRDRAAYLAAIDGLVWGNGPQQGYVSRGAFVHPALGFAFDVPPGYQLSNHPDAVMVNGPRDAVFLLDSVPDPGGDLAEFLARRWVPEIGDEVRAGEITGLRATRLNGLPAAQGRVVLHGEHSERIADLTVVRLDGRLYRLTGLHRVDDAAGQAILARTAGSFRGLSRFAALRSDPPRLRIHRIRAGEDVVALARSLPVASSRATFDVLNGLRPGKALRVGDEVKLVTP